MYSWIPARVVVLHAIPRVREPELVTMQMCVFDKAAARVLVKVVAGIDGRVHQRLHVCWYFPCFAVRAEVWGWGFGFGVGFGFRTAGFRG